MKRLLILFLSLLSAPLFGYDIQLIWNPSPSTNVTGYRVYWTSNNVFVPYRSTAGLTMPVTNLANGVTYTFYATATNSFGLESVPGNTVTNRVGIVPVISSIPSQSTPADTGITVSFTVSDADTPAASLTLFGSSSNPALVPNTSITFGGTGNARQITLIPIPGQTGTSIISVTVSDGTGTATTTFALTVTVPNTAPMISDIGNQAIGWNSATPALPFTVSDTQSAGSALTVTVSSSNPNLVTPSNIVLGGSGNNRTITIAPLPNTVGTATITVTVSDGSLTASDSFDLLVVGPPSPPTGLRFQ